MKIPGVVNIKTQTPFSSEKTGDRLSFHGIALKHIPFTGGHRLETLLLHDDIQMGEADGEDVQITDDQITHTG
jgi:hypothetical protein